MDQAGDIFGSTIGGGTGDLGTIFNLTGDGNQWIETSIYDFPANSKGGASPNRIIVDKRGNIYGTTIGSRDGYGLAFEVKP